MTTPITMPRRVVGWPHWVATSDEPDIHRALGQVRDYMRRQQDDAKTRIEPRNNRHLRDTPIVGAP